MILSEPEHYDMLCPDYKHTTDQTFHAVLGCIRVPDRL